MKKKLQASYKLFLVILLSTMVFSTNNATACIGPNATVKLLNDVQVSSTVYEFDLYLLVNGSAPLTTHQYGVNFNSAIINGGTLTATLISGTSSLTNTLQIPSSLSIVNVSGTWQIQIASPPDPLSNYSIISITSPGTRIGRIRITNTVAFATAQANLSVNLLSSGGLFPTTVSFLICGSSFPANSMTGDNSGLVNPVLNPCTNPSVPTINTSVNPVCSGSPTTLSIATGNLNSATSWKWYSGSCNGTPEGTGTSITVNPTSNTTYYVRGEGGCVTPGSCASTSVLIDNIPPTALCQNISVLLNVNGIASATASVVDNGSNDACGIASKSLSKTVFTCADMGVNTITLTVTDNSNNTSTCTSTVTVLDYIAPSITCPANITSCNSMVTFTTTGTDNCGTPVITFQPPSGSNFPSGINTVTAKATDASGNIATCTFTVTVNPSIIINATKTNLRCGGICNGSASIAITGGTAPFTYAWADGSTNSSLSNLCIGNYTCTVTDANGCSKSKSVSITGNAAMTLTIFPTASTLSASVSGGVPPINYLWNTSPLQTNATATGLLSNHSYKVKVTDSKNCTQLVLATTQPAKYSESDGLNLVLYPNPSDGIVTLDFNSIDSFKYNLSVMDLTGRMIYNSVDYKPQSYFSKTYDFNKLAKGVYYLQVKTDTNNQVIRLVLE